MLDVIFVLAGAGILAAMVAQLRAKLGDNAEPRIIDNEAGVGYRLSAATP